MTDRISSASALVGWGDPLGDEQAEVLRDLAEPLTVGGESDWRVAVYVYDLDEDLTDSEGVTVAAGQYVRAVEGNQVNAWAVESLTGARLYAQAVEAAYADETGAVDRPDDCEECGAEPGEPCRVPNCQGDWDQPSAPVAYGRNRNPHNENGTTDDFYG